jgi:S-DNA-T family DNA segregation ATPase FtsK/SpoIIIE
MATTPGCDQALVGLLDDPARQRQVGAAWDLDRDGSLLVYGTTGSGKTTLLRSLAVSLALAASPDELHLYALDFATRGLNSLAALPHCGGVIAGDDVERTQRVFAIVDREIALRKELFARAGVSSLREFRERQPDHPVARIVVLVDGWSAFTNTFEQIDYGELLDRLPQLIGDGRALGVHFVLAADRANAVRTTISGVISRSVVLRMADDDDYASLGLDYRLIRGAQIPPGRGFTDGTLEVQCALVGSEPSGPGQNAAIEAAGQRLQAAHPGQGVPEVRNLPTEVWQSDLPADDGPLRVVVGMRDVDLGAAVLDLADGNLLVTGPTRSGKTTALATIAQSTLASNPDAELYVLSPRRSELGDLGIWKAAARGEEQCNDLARRLAEAMDERSGTEAPIVIIVDDGHELADTSADASLARVVRRGQDVRMTVVGASESTTAHRAYSGWIPEIKKDRRALLLVPDVDIDGDLSGVRLPRRSSLVFPPGRGYLVERGQVRLLQVAL